MINIEGGLEGNSNEFLDVSSRVQDVINLSGGLQFKERIIEGDAALANYHGTNDQLVPFGHDIFLGPNNGYMDGSEEIHRQATAKNVPNHLHPVFGGGHYDIYREPYLDEYKSFREAAFDLFRDSVLCKRASTSIRTTRMEEEAVKLFPNPASEFLNIEYPGDELLELLIFDGLGRQLGIWKFDRSKTNIHISSFLSGIYFYFIKKEINHVQSGKLVINNG